MTLETRDFVIANLVIVTLVVISYLRMRRTPRQPVRLNLKGSDERDVTPGTSPSAHVPNFSSVEYRPRASNKQILGQASSPHDARPHVETAGYEITNPGATDLNVLFNWNGHTWDAYEVLDIPAGSSTAAAKVAFERLRKEVDPQSIPFVTAAFEAIRARG